MQIDLRYANRGQGDVIVVVAPVLRFKDVGFNADVTLEVSWVPVPTRHMLLICTRYAIPSAVRTPQSHPPISSELQHKSRQLYTPACCGFCQGRCRERDSVQIPAAGGSAERNTSLRKHVNVNCCRNLQVSTYHGACAGPGAARPSHPGLCSGACGVAFARQCSQRHPGGPEGRPHLLPVVCVPPALLGHCISALWTNLH